MDFTGDTLAPQVVKHKQPEDEAPRIAVWRAASADVRTAVIANGLAPYNWKSLSPWNFYNFILFVGVGDSEYEKDQILINEYLSMA